MELTVLWEQGAWISARRCQTRVMEFNFTLNFGYSFNFSLDTRKKSTSTDFVKKKLSPSSVGRNARRKEAFLKQKAEASKKSEDTFKVETSIQEIDTFQCDHCDYQVNCEVLLRKHMDKEDKLIPQLDGLEDPSSKELDPCPLCKDQISVAVADMVLTDVAGVAVTVLPATCLNIKGGHGYKAICDDLVNMVFK